MEKKEQLKLKRAVTALQIPEFRKYRKLVVNSI